MTDGIEDAGAPNCAVDLVPMRMPEDAGSPRWTCPECGLVRFV
jgi:hypothetical protein